jgi:hypothetical protein
VLRTENRVGDEPSGAVGGSGERDGTHGPGDGVDGCRIASPTA